MITFRALEDGQLINYLFMGYGITFAEAYDKVGTLPIWASISSGL